MLRVLNIMIIFDECLNTSISSRPKTITKFTCTIALLKTDDDNVVLILKMEISGTLNKSI